jgi:galactokinase
MAELIDLILSEFKTRFGGEPAVFSAPGRVNLIGEHTDYNEGFVLPFAIQNRTYAACAPRKDRIVRIYTRTLDESAEFSLDETAQARKKEWSSYVRGIAAVLERGGVRLTGADMVIDSDIPFGAGLSSSAALEVCAGLALWTVSGGETDLYKIAKAGQKVEHEFIGVRSGLMDQLSSALARRDNVLLIDCRTNAVRYIPLEFDDLSFAICDTRVKHELASTAYNNRREECERGVDLLAGHVGEIRSLRDVSVEQFESHEESLPDPIRQRCRHVVTENARVLAFVDAIENRNFFEAGRLMYLSHESLRDDYEVSSPELDILVDTALRLPGVLGSRMTGGGFGGCTISLIEKAYYAEFRKMIGSSYEKRVGSLPEMSLVIPSDGARKDVTSEPMYSTP